MVSLDNKGKPGLDYWPDPSAQEILATARAYVAAGLSVVPVLADGSKRPAVAWKQFQETKPTDEILLTWFAGFERYGIGIPCGGVSDNLEVIDIDDLPLCPEYFELVKTHDPELYKSLVIIETPSGCKHLLYRCEKIKGNQKLAMRAVEVEEGTNGAKKEGDKWVKFKTLIETRGQGGYIVAPGSPLSVHSEGKPYRFIKGSAETIPTIKPAAREMLLGLARALNEYHPTEEKREKTEYKQASQSDGDESLPGKDFDKRGDSLLFRSTRYLSITAISRLYVKTLESAGGVPFDQLEFLPAAVATTGDPLVDALLADEVEALAEWKQRRL